jgi:type I restriction enzyme S subunit
VVQLTNGFVGPTRDILVADGIRYIQGMHIKNGRIDFERRPFFVSPEWHNARPRTSLRTGDVLIVQTGDVAQCAVVPPEFGSANCHALLIARPDQSIVTSEYLGAYLQSDFGRASLLRLATGALHPHLEFGIRDAPVVVPPLADQAALVDAVKRDQSLDDRMAATVHEQILLLVERRQALITAAVTGELTIPGVAA